MTRGNGGTDYSSASLPIAIPLVAHISGDCATAQAERGNVSGSDSGPADEQFGKVELYAVLATIASEACLFAAHLTYWRGGDMPGLVGIAKLLAENPSTLLYIAPILPTLALVWLIYRMHIQNDRNFREVIRVIRDVGKVINENTSALDRVNREDEHDRHKRH